MRALPALPLFLALLALPGVAADAGGGAGTEAEAGAEAGTAAAASPDPLGCLFRPYFPETPLYYILWWCTAGQFGVPEPLYAIAGCTVGFPITDIECTVFSTPDLADELRERADRVESCLAHRPTVGCILGVEPDPVACLLDYIRTQTPCR